MYRHEKWLEINPEQIRDGEQVAWTTWRLLLLDKVSAF